MFLPDRDITNVAPLMMLGLIGGFIVAMSPRSRSSGRR